MVVTFTVEGDPQGKARPRFSTANGRFRAVTPKQTVKYENSVKWAYKKNCGSQRFEDNASLNVKITAYYGIPQSKSNSKKEQMRANTILPTKKPDCDNVAKAVLDALNQIAYKDDAQVAELTVLKRYSDNPRVEVIIQSSEK
ncbi:MAG: RusA family crossover junction endodeoxyribonuclease [Oscillospiraceae bacterium]|nr:RusA family crossover junction endodeoxyribonuclease [Oscillospiraceae bacterium]